MLIFGTCNNIVSRSKFQMKDMREADVILGVRIIRMLTYCQVYQIVTNSKMEVQISFS